MIQRIQSVWLFLASMMCGLLFIMKLYHVDTPQPGLLGMAPAHVIEAKGVRDAGNAALFIVAALITVLPLITIFFFGDRKRQKGFVWISVIACLSFISVTLMKIGNVHNKLPDSRVSYDFGLLLPVVAIVFLFLALAGIRKDDKLIKSLDRLR